MRFADPHACPACRGPIASQARCPRCGLDLASTEVRQLWQTLLAADDLLARAIHQSHRPAAATAPTGPVGGPEPFPSYPAAPPFHPAPPTSPPTRQRSWSVGTILLGLGAFGLIVAGFIFVTRSWGDLGLVGRTLVLTGVTAVFAGLAVWVTRRPLRSSAEAVWTIVLALLTLDFFAARHEGMIGLGGLGVAWAWVVWGIVLAALGVAVALFGRPWVKADLVAPAIAAGLGISMSGAGAAAVADDWDLSWRSIVALVVAGLLALATRPAAVRPLTVTARVVTAGFFIWALVVAAVELIDHPSLHEVVVERHGVPLALMTVASVVIGWVVRQVRVPAAALAVVAAGVLVATPMAQEWRPEGIVVAVAALAGVLSVAGWRGTSEWVRGLRAGAVPAIVALLVVHLGLLLELLDACGTALDRAWDGSWDLRLGRGWAHELDAWVMPFPVLALLLTAWFVPRWPEAGVLAGHRRSILAVALGVTVANGVTVVHAPLWAGVAAVILTAGLLAAAQWRGVSVWAGPAAAVLVVVAATLATHHQGVSAAAWLSGAIVLAVLAVSTTVTPLGQAYAVGGVGLTVGAVATAVDLFEPSAATTALAGVVTALLLVTAAGTVWRELPVRIAVEVAAGVAGLIPLVTEGTTAELTVRWTVVGVWLIALSFVVMGRRFYLWPGVAALVVAYILLIVDSGFSFVEAYTLPLGAVALAIGLYATRRQPTVGTWLSLGPGLAIALLPSVPQALADPTDLRALLLGLGAVVALALGARLGWQAPFVAGAVIVTLLVLFNIGPYANAAPRVVLIAGISVILLGVGITWEDRVRDGRRLVGYVRSMR